MNVASRPGWMVMAAVWGGVGCSASTLGLTDGASVSSTSSGDEPSTGPGSPTGSTADASSGSPTTGTTGEGGVDPTTPIDPGVCVVPGSDCDDACLAECDGGCDGQLREAGVVAVAQSGNLDEGSTGLVPGKLGVTPTGGLVLTGNYVGSPDLGLGPLPLSDPDEVPYFVLHLDPEGVPISQAAMTGLLAPAVLVTPGGRIFLVGNSVSNRTAIHEVLPTYEIVVREEFDGYYLNSSVALAGDTLYLAGACNADSTADVLFGRYTDGELVTRCLPGTGQAARLGGLVEVPGGDVVLGGYAEEDVDALGLDVPDMLVAEQPFVVRIAGDFTEVDLEVKATQVAGAEMDGGLNGASVSQVVWNGRHVITAGTIHGTTDFGLDAPVEVDQSQVYFAAYDPATLAPMAVLLPNLNELVQVVPDCAGDLVASSVIGKATAPLDGPDLVSDKENALVVFKVRSSADAPLSGLEWAQHDRSMAQSEGSSSIATGLATSADRVLVYGIYIDVLDLGAAAMFPGIASSQAATFLAALAP